MQSQVLNPIQLAKYAMKHPIIYWGQGHELHCDKQNHILVDEMGGAVMEGPCSCGCCGL